MPATTGPDNERITFTAFLSVLLHAVVIAGLGFVLSQPEVNADVQLVFVHDPIQSAPQDAQRASYAHQKGSGEDDKDQPARIPQLPLVVGHEILPQSQLVVSRQAGGQQASHSPNSLNAQVLKTASPSLQVTTQLGQRGAVPNSQLTNTGRRRLAAEIISIETYLGQLEQQQARRPRIKRYTSITAMQSDEAAYIHGWVRKVERVGNLNYPSQAQDISGALRLLVVLNAAGKVLEMEVLSSSGYPVLDDAARRIVRLAEGFGEFPRELRQQADQIEIIRTWQFIAGEGETRLEFK